MCNLQALEAAVEQLDSCECAQFRAWFERFDAVDWDRQRVQDVETGALDWLAEEAMADLATGRCRER
jgi:hypothetical protein